MCSCTGRLSWKQRPLLEDSAVLQFSFSGATENPRSQVEQKLAFTDDLVVNQGDIRRKHGKMCQIGIFLVGIKNKCQWD